MFGSDLVYSLPDGHSDSSYFKFRIRPPVPFFLGSTFDSNIEFFTCGVYRSAHSEIVETEKFAMVYYCTPDKNILGTKLYSGYESG